MWTEERPRGHALWTVGGLREADAFLFAGSEARTETVWLACFFLLTNFPARLAGRWPWG